MSYIMPDSWWWGNRGFVVADRLPGDAVSGVRVVAGGSKQVLTASERFWRQIRLLLFGFVGIAVGVGSLTLYRYNSDMFLVASTGFTMLYTLLTLFMALRGQNPYANNRDWSQAIEVLSYFQLFNTFFVMLCVVEITFKTKSRGSFNYNRNNGQGGDKS